MAPSARNVARSAGLLATESLRTGLDRVLPDGALPRRGRDITPGFLERALRLDAGSVRAVEVLREDSGTASRALLGVEADRATGLPSRLFVKLPPRRFDQHLLMNLMGLGTQEVTFYRRIAPRAPVRVPHCYGTGLEPRRGRNLILLEDLGPSARFRDVRASCDLPEAEAVVDALADLHATFWQADGPSPDLAGYGARSESATLLGYAVARRLLGNLRSEAADIVPAEVRRGSRVLLDKAPVDAFWASLPQTVIHGDTHLGNLFFEDGSPGFLDWQVSTVGPGIRDVAYFVVASVDPPLARQTEHGLVERYAARLGAAGVEVDADELWTLYRAGVSEFYVSAVATMETGERMQPAEVARVGVERAALAAEALQTFDVLASLVAAHRGR